MTSSAIIAGDVAVMLYPLQHFVKQQARRRVIATGWPLSFSSRSTVVVPIANFETLFSQKKANNYFYDLCRFMFESYDTTTLCRFTVSYVDRRVSTRDALTTSIKIVTRRG